MDNEQALNQLSRRDDDVLSFLPAALCGTDARELIQEFGREVIAKY